ncbi:MAG: hypothetical protein Q9181_007438, partial [Wetmoreana brouardii]
MENLSHMAACLPEHLEMLQQENKQQELEEASMTSMFTAPVYEYMQALAEKGQCPFPQYGLLGGATDLLDDSKTLGKASVTSSSDDPRLFTNTTTPFSAFICGSQGSGKINRILREMRMLQQASGIPFQFADFKDRLAYAGLTPTQLAPLNQRLETLESFLAPESSIKKSQKGKQKSKDGGTNWHPK